MNTLKARTHNFAIVPLWLSELMCKAKCSYSVLTSYEQLSTIASIEDVCFYHQYLLNAKRYLGNDFDDMCNIANMPENMAWIAANENTALTTQLIFNATLKKHEDTLMATDTPETVRKTHYVPRAVEDTTLLLLAVRETNSPDARSFLKSCIEELHQQKRYDEIKQYRVFKSYCVA